MANSVPQQAHHIIPEAVFDVLQTKPQTQATFPCLEKWLLTIYRKRP